MDRDIGTAARVLEEAARKWRNDGTNLTWLVETPMIEYQGGVQQAPPLPARLGGAEAPLQRARRAPSHHGLFAVDTGLRDQELCGLEWAWEQRVPELDTPTIKRSVFLLPGTVTKNGRPRLAILNDVVAVDRGEPAG